MRQHRHVVVSFGRTRQHRHVVVSFVASVVIVDLSREGPSSDCNSEHDPDGDQASKAAELLHEPCQPSTTSVE